MKELHPDARIGIISGPLTNEIVDIAIEIGCFSVAPTLDGTPQEAVDKAKAAGLKVNLWHSENIDLWRKVKAMGADVTTSNHPVEILKAIAAEK